MVSAAHRVIFAGVAWLGVGTTSVAWTCSARLVDREDRGRRRLIVLGPKADSEIVRHELGHTWHSPQPKADGTINGAVLCIGEIGLREHARATGWEHRFDEHVAREERLANACAYAWR